jgi:predicted DNA-binding transcriptional regulator YafY
MTQAERRHDRLAVRLSLIISRLVAGETLSVRKLAAEFGVSVRTLRRDFRERLMYLDLEYQSGYCRLRTAGSETQMVPDVLIFAHRSGMAGLFPGFDRRLVNALLMCDESPCVIAPASPAPSPSGALSFWRLIQAITGRRRVTLIAEGQRCERLAPCRLLIHQQAWYLVAEHDGHIAVFTLDEIHLVQPLQETFRRNDSLCVWLKTRCLFRPYPIFALSSSHCLRLFRPTAHRNSAGLYQPGNRESPMPLLPLSPLLSSSSF